MTRILTEGFELGINTCFETYETTSLFQTTRVRSGSYAFAAQSGDNNSIPFPPTTEIYFAFGFNAGNTSESGVRVIWRSGTSGQAGGLGMNGGVIGPEAHFRAYVGTNAVATGTAAISGNGVNDWYWIEIYLKMDDTNGRLVVKVDGNIDIDYTGDTKPTTYTSIDHITLTCPSVSSFTYYDDLIIDDGGWPGNHKIIWLPPSGNGDVVQFTPSAGQNYACVDEIPPNTTDYVSTFIAGNYDLYHLLVPDLTGATIHGVQPIVYAKDIGSNGTLTMGMKSGSTENWEVAAKTLTNVWSLYKGNFNLTDPTDSQPWTYSKLQNLQVGMKAG
jgi:hypothetical protein